MSEGKRLIVLGAQESGVGAARLAKRRGRLVLVLDDYQFASGPEVDALLAFLIDNLPVQLHLVVVSREAPAIPLARLRAQGQVLSLIHI